MCCSAGPEYGGFTRSLKAQRKKKEKSEASLLQTSLLKYFYQLGGNVG
jgi:hypothetical protein